MNDGFGWEDLRLDRELHYEDKVARRIAEKCGGSALLRCVEGDDERLSLASLVEAGFPYQLRATSARLPEDFAKAIWMRPSKTPVYDAWLDAREDLPDDVEQHGVVFKWPGFGSFFVFHDIVSAAASGLENRTPQLVIVFGPRRKRFFLESLDGLLETVGSFAQW